MIFHVLQQKDLQINFSDCYPDLHYLKGAIMFYILLPCMIELVSLCSVFFIFKTDIIFLLLA
jgi:hypothetical protein